MFFKILFEGFDGTNLKVAVTSAVMSRDTLNGEKASLVGFRGVEGVSTDEKFVDAFAIRIFNFEVDVKPKAPFNIATELAVRVAGIGVF